MNEIINLSGSFIRDKYIPNNSLDRDNFIGEVHRTAEKNDYNFFVELTEDYIKHLDRQFTINFYFRDWPRVMQSIKSFYGPGVFYIVNGFRSPYELGISPHSTGLAIDILVENQEKADRLMNAAYMAGVPTIIPAGNIADGQGHVHLDLAPTPNYVYNSGTYTGPWGV